MSFYTSWLIGATNFGSAQTFTINGTGYQVDAGDYYLRDATASRSLLDQVEAAMIAEGLANASVFLDQSGYVHLKSDDSFAVVWTGTDLRNALGWTGNIASTTDATAPRHSPLWWSPGWPETPTKTPVGAESYPVPGKSITASPSGRTRKTTIHHTAEWQEWTWKQVPIDRVWVPPYSNGEFRMFWETVLNPGFRFKLYSGEPLSGIQENPGSPVEVVWVTAQGPYKDRDPKSHDWYNRSSFPGVDSITDIEIRAAVVDDI